MRGTAAGQGEAPAPGAKAAPLTALFASGTFRLYLLVQLMTRFALGFVQVSLPFYVAHALRLPDTDLSLALGVMLGSALITVPLWPRVLSRWGPARTGAAVGLALAVLCLPFFWIHGRTALVVTAALMGPAYGGLSVVLDLLYAGVVDADQAQTGEARGGVIGGVTGTMLRLAPAIAGVVLAQALAAAGFDSRLALQPPAVGIALRLMLVLVPVAALGTTAALMLRLRSPQDETARLGGGESM
jgi:Na+/melibiose symporter-like transporter